MKKYVLLLTFWAASIAAVNAAPIIGLYNTGVNNSNVLLGATTTDTHYRVVSGPGSPIQATTLAPGFPVGPYMNEGPTSRWISSGALNTTAPATFVYQTTFTLPAEFVSAQLTGLVAADNEVTIRLNGVTIGTAAGFASFTNFATGSGFQPGLNTLEFLVFNAGTTDTGNPSALRVDSLQGSYVATPEIDANHAAAPLALVLGALMLVQDRRRRASELAVETPA